MITARPIIPSGLSLLIEILFSESIGAAGRVPNRAEGLGRMQAQFPLAQNDHGARILCAWDIPQRRPDEQQPWQ